MKKVSGSLQRKGVEKNGGFKTTVHWETIESRFAALALLSSDALSSIAYGTEQIVVVLVTLSAAAIWYSLPIAAFVIILLISLTLSYRQIIHAYPHGGGAYVVSSENLGRNAGLLAGGSLLVDYMLTQPFQFQRAQRRLYRRFQRYMVIKQQFLLGL